MTPSNVERELERLNQHWELLTTKLTKLEQQHILETRVEEKFRIKALIDDTRTERDAIETQIATLQQPTPSDATASHSAASRPTHSVNIKGNAKSKGNMVFGNRTEGSPPPTQDADRSIHIDGNAEADGDMTFGNHHTVSSVHRPGHAASAPSSGTAKRIFTKRLGGDWRGLADVLEIPLHEQRSFVQGDEARAIWAWLEVRAKLACLPDALRAIDRGDLAGELSALK